MQSQGLTDTNRAICHIPVSASRSFRAGSGRPLTITMARGSISGTALGLLLTPAAVQIAPSERSGRNSSSAPECARSKVPGRSAWSLVRKSDRAGRTERAQKSGAGLPNTQPRIMTPCTATLPAHSARRTGALSGSHYGHGFAQLMQMTTVPRPLSISVPVESGGFLRVSSAEQRVLLLRPWPWLGHSWARRTL